MFLRRSETSLASVFCRAMTVETVAILGMLALLCVLFLTPLLQIRPDFPLIDF